MKDESHSYIHPTVFECLEMGTAKCILEQNWLLKILKQKINENEKPYIFIAKCSKMQQNANLESLESSEPRWTRLNQALPL